MFKINRLSLNIQLHFLILFRMSNQKCLYLSRKEKYRVIHIFARGDLILCFITVFQILDLLKLLYVSAVWDTFVLSAFIMWRNRSNFGCQFLEYLEIQLNFITGDTNKDAQPFRCHLHTNGLSVYEVFILNQLWN